MAENLIRGKQINQSDLSGFVAQVVQDTGVLGNTFVTTTSNQNISGIKTFLNNLNVSGDLTIAGTLRYNEIIDTTVTGNISGYTGIFTTIFANNLVYNTGNQSIFGVKTFNNSGIFIDGIDIGGEIDNGIVKIYDSSQGSYINIFPSDGTLTFQLENNNQSLAFDLSSLGNNETAIIATDSQVVHKAGNETISGVKTFATGIFAPNLVYNTGNQTISGIKTFATGIFAPNLVYNTGDQTISGIKTFASRPTVNNTGILFSGEAIATPIISDYTVTYIPPGNGIYLLPTGYRNVNYRVTSETPAGDISLILPSGGQNIGDQIIIDYYQNNSSQEFIRVSGYLKPSFVNPQTIDSDLSETVYHKNSVSYIFTNRSYAGGIKTWEKITANAPTISYLKNNNIFVATTGNQTISGIKTFANSISGTTINSISGIFGFNQTFSGSAIGFGGGSGNRITGNYIFIGGGQSNFASGNYSTIGGGGSNCATASYSNVGGGGSNCATALYSNVGGGYRNCATALYSNVGGGTSNCATGNYSTIGGGGNNCATATYSTVGGGELNCATATYSTVGGGYGNFATACYSTIGGGSNNCATGNFSLIGGGERNCAFASHSYIIGGRCSVIQTSHSGAAVFGDGQNRAHNSYSSNSLTLDFDSGVYFSNKKIFGFTPEINNFTNNFLISGNLNSDIILATSATQITGTIVSGNATGFNVSIIQAGAGQIQITGSGSNVIVSSYNNQFRTAGQFATISLLHTGNNRYIMYGNTI